jgi:hypothetical protein
MISGTGSRLLVTENGFGYVMLVCLAQTKCLWELNSSPNSRLIEGWEVGCEIIQGMDRESENRGGDDNDGLSESSFGRSNEEDREDRSHNSRE